MSDPIMLDLSELIGKTFLCDSELITRQTVSDDVDGWDSLSHAVLFLRIEKHFGLKLSRHSFFSLGNVGQIADMIAANTTPVRN